MMLQLVADLDLGAANQTMAAAIMALAEASPRATSTKGTATTVKPALMMQHLVADLDMGTVTLTQAAAF